MSKLTHIQQPANYSEKKLRICQKLIQYQSLLLFHLFSDGTLSRRSSILLKTTSYAHPSCQLTEDRGLWFTIEDRLTIQVVQQLVVEAIS